ncbi:MAG: hypothetical protein PHU63_01115 [Candidatus ainarchaeum sp.]|nr:hypothetical protein [Candidatus ainarchaeum sp.]
MNFIPGCLLSFSLLKEKNLLFFEKLFIGFAIGLVLLPLIPFILGILGILYSYTIAIFSVLIFYILSLILFIKEKTWEEFKLPKLSYSKENLVAIVLVVVVFLAFWIRVQSYSPIFPDVDPYFYLYSTTQILTLGIPPLNDGTAWYPEVIVDHRYAPSLAYLESLWYSFYTSGGEYNNYLLSLVASFYPPIMAALAIFFLYLLLSSVYNREFGLIAASVASFIPIFIAKLAAGEFEVQPYAFFAISMFYAFYVLSIKNRDWKFTLLASLGFAAVFLGSSSAILALAVLIIFIPLYSILLFFKREIPQFLNFLKLNGLFIFVGVVLPAIFHSIYKNKFLFSNIHYALFFIFILSCILYYIRLKYWDQFSKEKGKVYLYSGVFFVAILLLLFFTPVGSWILGAAKSGLSTAQFTSPLYRTIQEQAATDSVFIKNMLGFAGTTFPEPINYIFIIFSYISNTIIVIIAEIGNIILGLSLSFPGIENSPMSSIILLFLFAFILSLSRELKGEDTLSLLFIAIVFPPLFIGLFKSKYIIYSGFMLAIAFGFILGEFSNHLSSFSKRLEKDSEKQKHLANKLMISLLAIGILLSLLQFSNSAAPGILMYSLQPKFQNDPSALKDKFTSLCNELASVGQYDYDICTAAQDPIAYASKGTEYQYNQKLCIYSIAESTSKVSTFEKNAISFGCARLNDYWLETMEWIKDHQDKDMRITSWWDYGHWINYFGEKNTVLRNEHASHKMIGEVAHAFIDGTSSDLKNFMLSHDSEYVLFDSELLFNKYATGLSGFGGKFGALNYLSCARDNETNVEKSSMQSACEWDHLWEIIFVPKTSDYYQECTISKITGEKGVVVFSQGYIYDASEKITPKFDATYCLGKTTLMTGQTTDALYSLNEKYENGDLKLHKAFLVPAGSDSSFNIYHLAYTRDSIWIENGQMASGWVDRKNKFYDSNLYKAFILKELEGFELVFESANGDVKIFKIKD